MGALRKDDVRSDRESPLKAEHFIIGYIVRTLHAEKQELRVRLNRLPSSAVRAMIGDAAIFKRRLNRKILPVECTGT